MRVALLSDIHGNLTALNVVLSDIEKRGGVDRIFCLGDVATTGPQPGEVIELIRERRWPTIMGNTDDDMIKSVPEKLGPDASEEEGKKRIEMDTWTIDRLSKVHRTSLLTFRPTIEYRPRGGPRFLFYHGSPRSYVEKILPTTPDDELRTILGGSSGEIFAGGHTHSQMFRRIDHSVVVNPGSVGFPFERLPSGRVAHPSHAEYGIVNYAHNILDVELLSVAYPLSSLSKLVKKSVPDPRWWLKDWYQAKL